MRFCLSLNRHLIELILKIPYNLPNYSAQLARSVRQESPIFLSNDYCYEFRKAAANPQWLAENLLASSINEIEGSRKLTQLATSISTLELSQKVKDHADDELLHFHLYQELIELLFEHDADYARSDIIERSVDVTGDEIIRNSFDAIGIFDIFTQINLSEIRTLVNASILESVLINCCPDKAKPKLTKLFSRLTNDETRHIRYTAEILEDGLLQERFQKVFMERLQDLDKYTQEEIKGN